MRLIDADALNYVRVRIAHDDGTIGGYNAVVPSSEIKNAPTIDAIPIEWILNHERMPKEGKGHDAIMDMIKDWRREHD